MVITNGSWTRYPYPTPSVIEMTVAHLKPLSEPANTKYADSWYLSSHCGFLPLETKIGSPSINQWRCQKVSWSTLQSKVKPEKHRKITQALTKTNLVRMFIYWLAHIFHYDSSDVLCLQVWLQQVQKAHLQNLLHLPTGKLLPHTIDSFCSGISIGIIETCILGEIAVKLHYLLLQPLIKLEINVTLLLSCIKISSFFKVWSRRNKDTARGEVLPSAPIYMLKEAMPFVFSLVYPAFPAVCAPHVRFGSHDHFALTTIPSSSSASSRLSPPRKSFNIDICKSPTSSHSIFSI